MTLVGASDPLRQRGRTALIALVWIGGVAGAIGVVAVSLVAGEPRGSALALFYAALPVPVLWFCFWWLDRVEPEPRRYIWAAFIWGAVPAVLIGITLELVADRFLQVGENFLIAVAAPLAEESAKGAFLLLTFLRARRTINGVLDGIILAGVAAFGFATVENVLYYAGAWSDVESLPLNMTSAQATTATFIMRGLVTPLAHPLFTSALGIAIGVALLVRPRIAKLSIIVAGWLISVSLHALWNGSIVLFGGWGLLVAYLVLMVYLVAVTTVAIVLRVRASRTAVRALTHVAARGWLHPDEVPYLANLHYRRVARSFAKANYGKEAAAILKQYQNLATELAFEYDRSMRTGLPGAQPRPYGVQRTHALLDAMWALRAGVRLPPPLYGQPGR
jgi:RsiW-degrading membrane proteinase PrsW (M82 family)